MFVGFSERIEQNRLIGLYSISLQSGYKGFAPSAKLAFMLSCLYRGVIPLLTRINGYLPAKSIKLGEDLPKNVAMEFAEWGLIKSYHLGFLNDNPSYNHFDKLSIPVFFLNFSDDEWSTKSAITPMKNLFKNCEVEEKYANPAEFELKKVGHTGFFHPRCEAKLWKNSLDWITKTFESR